MALLELKGLTKRFGGLCAVDELDMQVEEGRIAGLIGPNGAGKTTIFNLISGVFHPTKGDIYFNGHRITHLKPHAVAERGLVRTFQSSSLFMEKTALDNVIIGCHMKAGTNFLGAVFDTPRTRRANRNVQEKAREITALMGLTDFADVAARDLPHGHQRALGVAIALAAEPRMLLLDEPMTGMNANETLHMMQLIRQMQRERKVTVLLVEHDMKAVMGLCSPITVVSFGKKIAEGTPEEIQTNAEVIQAYLGVENAA